MVDKTSQLPLTGLITDVEKRKVEDILGKQEEVNVESLLGSRPPSEEAMPQVPIEGMDERQQYLIETIASSGGETAGINISPYLKAIPPTLWELVKTQTPGVKLFSEEFKQSSWFMKAPNLPPEFDNKEITMDDLIRLNEEYKKEMPGKADIISGEIGSLASFLFFPVQMKMLGEFVGPPIQRFAPTLYKVLTNRLRMGKWWQPEGVKIEPKPIKI